MAVIHHLLRLSPVLICFAVGCQSRRPTQPERPPPTRATAQAIKAEASVNNHATPSPAPPAVVENEPIPLWEPTKFVRVEVMPYVNEKGEAFPRTYKYVPVEPGKWNSEALEHPDRAYIPAENVPRVPNSTGVSYSSVVSPGRGAVARRQSTGEVTSSLPTTDLYDISDVIILGLMEASQNIEAEHLVPGGYVAIYDDNLGWIGVPKAHLTGIGEIAQ